MFFLIISCFYGPADANPRFPTPPYVENGVECGSPKNQFFAIRSHEEALAFLNFQEDGVNLRKNYLEILEVLQQQLKLGRKLETLVGEDEKKIRSSLKFFLEVAQQSSDDQLQLSCEETLQLIERGQTGQTLQSNCGSSAPLCSLCSVQWSAIRGRFSGKAGKSESWVWKTYIKKTSIGTQHVSRTLTSSGSDPNF